MEIQVKETLGTEKADAIILPFWEYEGLAKVAFEDRFDISGVILPIIDMGDFKGKLSETLLMYVKHRGPSDRLILVGLGEEKDFSAEKFRRAMAAASKVALGKKLKNIAVILPLAGKLEDKRLVYLAAESILMTDYDFDMYKSKKDAKAAHVESLTILTEVEAKEEVARAKKIADAINFARDLININADQMTPERLAKAAHEIAESNSSIKVRVFGLDEIIKQGFGLIHAVGRASRHEPALIIAEYTGDPTSNERTVIIGKGITYDTGGLSLKPTDNMDGMKADMAGGAAVLGAIKAAAELHLKVNLTALVASAENAIGSNSYKLGDVYTSYSGQTVEIKNTDAEGRLVLADAISYAVNNIKPSRVIDLATLTGACMVALGVEKAGIFSNESSLQDKLMQAGDISGEKLWPLPLDEDYAEGLKSPLADLRNFHTRVGSLVFSGMFLKAFVKDTPWAHIDIAGPAYLDKPVYYHRSPATGFGIRLLLEFVQKCHHD